MKKYIFIICVAFLTQTLLVSCGGGGESSPVPQNNSTTNQDSPGNNGKTEQPEIPETPNEPSYPVYDAPTWSVVNQSSYECTMTAIVALPDSLRGNEQNSDKLAVFAGDVCRGTAERVDIGDGKYIWIAMIYGSTSESSTLQLHFRYWSAADKHMYRSESTFNFFNDQKTGNIDNPLVIGMKVQVE